MALAVPLGGVLFLPWLPSFLYQSAHTGTPWAPRIGIGDFFDALQKWWGTDAYGWVLTLVAAALAVLAVLGPVVGRGRFAAARRARAVPCAVVGLGGLALGLVISRVQGAGFSERYSIAEMVPYLFVVAAGLLALRRPARVAVLGLVVVLCLADCAFGTLLGTRTQAGATAALLRSRLGPGDLVVYCPDQIAPAVDRLLPAGTDEVVYPTMGSPKRVDWVDYAQRQAAASPSDFAAQVEARTHGVVWLVWMSGYATFGDQCERLRDDLAAARGPGAVLQTPEGFGDKDYVVRYAAAG